MHIQTGTWNLGQIQIFLPVGSRWRGRFPARSSRRYAHTPPGFQAAALPSLPAPLQGLHLAQEWFVGHCEPVCFTRTEQKARGGWMAPIDAAPLAQGARSTGAGVSQLPGASSASASPSAAAPKEGAMTND